MTDMSSLSEQDGSFAATLKTHWRLPPRHTLQLCLRYMLTKLVLTKITIRKFAWRQVDIVTAYLNMRSRRVYMRMPTGYAVEGTVCQLSRAMYGLSESAFLWNESSTTTSRNRVFRDSKMICTSTYGKTKHYIGDSIIPAPTQETVGNISNDITNKLPTKNLGVPSVFLGCNLQRQPDNGTINLGCEKNWSYSP